MSYSAKLNGPVRLIVCAKRGAGQQELATLLFGFMPSPPRSMLQNKSFLFATKGEEAEKGDTESQDCTVARKRPAR